MLNKLLLLTKMYTIFLLFCLITTTISANTRIIGGQNATVNQFPFAAAISVQTPNGNYFCGGTFYRRQFIITAGQCVYNATLFTIQLGSVHLDSDDPSRMTLATSEYFLHPDYNPLTLENDIAVIQLRALVTWTDYVRGIDSLPIRVLEPGIEVEAIGWGQMSDYDSNFAHSLQYVKVVALSNEECKITYGDQIKDGMLCIGGDYNEGICHGDTGSPLVEMYSARFTVLSGIASFVSGNGCESTDPSGYTRVYHYIEWLTNVTIDYL